MSNIGWNFLVMAVSLSSSNGSHSGFCAKNRRKRKFLKSFYAKSGLLTIRNVILFSFPASERSIVLPNCDSSSEIVKTDLLIL